MVDLKCPYCPEVRPSRSRLVTHVDSAHRNVSVARRTLDLRDPRTVTDIAIVGPELTEGEDRPKPLCVCGLPIAPLDEDTEYPEWTHAFGTAPKCRDAIPAAGMPTKQDRADLAAGWARVGEGLDKAGREMAEMRAALDAVDERMRKLDARLTSPATVRRATLNQVWDRLVDEGHMSAAAVVMKMISRVVDDQ